TLVPYTTLFRSGHDTVLVLVHVGGDDLVEQVRERLDQHIQRTGDQYGAVTGGAVALDGLERLGADRGPDAPPGLALHQRPQVLAAVPLVPAGDEADQLRAVALVGTQVAGHGREQTADLRGPGAARPGRPDHGEVLLDDVRGQHRAVEVEHGQGVGRLLQRGGGARGALPLGGLRPGV